MSVMVGGEGILLIQDRKYREVLLTFCSGGSSSTLSHSCVPESFYGKRDTQHMPSKLTLRRKWVETKLHNGHRFVATIDWEIFAAKIFLPVA